MAVDWEAVRQDYITTDMSLQQLANKYGTTKTSIHRHIKSGAWELERAEHRSVTPRNESRNDDETPLQPPGMIDIADGVLRLTRAIRAVLDEAPGRRAMNTSQYNALMSGIKTAMEIQREAYRIRTIAQEDSYHLAAERLKLERDRLELEKRRADIGGDDDGIELIIHMAEEEHAEESD